MEKNQKKYRLVTDVCEKGKMLSLIGFQNRFLIEIFFLRQRYESLLGFYREFVLLIFSDEKILRHNLFI